MPEINVVSGNPHKLEEMRPLAEKYGIKLNWVQYSKVEVQADSPVDIARVGGQLAFATLRAPLIVEDTGLFISALGGFPGAYAAQAFKTIGLPGILRLLEGSRDRSAYFKACICYVDERETSVFEGTAKGQIAKGIHRGRDFGYDPIFIPEGYSETFSELGLEEKGRISHRALAFKAFAEHFTRRRPG